jgi:hypothetical protein
MLAVGNIGRGSANVIAVQVKEDQCGTSEEKFWLGEATLAY